MPPEAALKRHHSAELTIYNGLTPIFKKTGDCSICTFLGQSVIIPRAKSGRFSDSGLL
jgi:hypothetical protein